MMKLFTSRYNNPALRDMEHLTKVGVTRGVPKYPLGYDLADNVRLLAPDSELFRVTDPDVFIPAFEALLDKRGFEPINVALHKIWRANDCKSLVLLCYEDCSILPNGGLKQWCHRLVIARWWKAHTGDAVLELEHNGREIDIVEALGRGGSNERAIQRRLF